MSKLVLVDGAKGHTGTFLVKEILESKPTWKIIATDLSDNKRPEVMTKEAVFSPRFKNMIDVLENERVTFIPADLTDLNSLEDLYYKDSLQDNSLYLKEESRIE